MKLTQFLKREFQSLGMSRQETAFVITLSIMLCILVSFIIVRVNNKPEEIWLEVPSTEEITKLLEEQEKLEDPQTEEDKPADNSQVTTRAYNEADSRIKQAEDLETLDDLLAKQEAENASGEGENSPEEDEGIEPPKVEPHKVNDGMSFKELEKYKAQPKDKKANRTLNITIKIAEVAPSVKEFSLSQQQLTLKVGEEKTIAIQGNDTYELGTSQTSQLTLSSDKKSLTIKAIKSGEERITIKDTKANKVISIQITVFKKLKLTPTSISLKEGETKSVTIEGNGDYVVINGQYASGSLSENKETLQIHGKAVGNGKVLVKDNKSKEEVFVEVTVTEKIKEFSLSPTMLNLTVEETAIVIIEGNGEYEIPTNSYVSLTLSNDKKKLSVKGIKAGETIIYIKKFSPTKMNYNPLIYTHDYYIMKNDISYPMSLEIGINSCIYNFLTSEQKEKFKDYSFFNGKIKSNEINIKK